MLDERLAAFLKSWPPAIVEDISGYFRAGRPPAAPRRAGRDDRSWTLLPMWLQARARGAASNRADALFLHDVLWGQYCLFLFVRIHDDLFDGQARSPALMFVADALLVESERSFAKHLRPGPFWDLFRDLVDRSLRAILEVDVLQRTPGGMRRESLDVYARVSSIFKVGSAAVCAKYRRTREFRHVSAFADHIAVAGQIVDDVMDVQEDLDRGRFNVAATQFGLGETANAGDRRRQIAHAVLIEDAVGSLVAEAKRHLDEAVASIRPVGLPQAIAYVNRSRRRLRAFTADLHRARVSYLLDPVVRS